MTLDAIFNRVIRNWRRGKRTWILADEFYILFRYSFSAEFFYRLFKRMRKYNAFITAISQNVDEILRSDTARLMLANSELLVMLNQAATDREELAKLLNISENQLSYITNVPAGHGLIRCGGAIIPFENSFPKNTIGTHTLAEELNARGLRTHSGAKFQANTIRRMLLDPEYAGYLVTDGAHSPFLPELQIVDAETKHRAIELAEQRSLINNEKRQVSRTCRGHSMLGGNLFCACCGKRLASVLKKDSYKRADGTVKKIVEPRYICYHASRHLNGCTGQQTYQAERIDRIILQTARMIFRRIETSPREAAIDLRMKNKVVQLDMAKKDIEGKIEKSKRELDVLGEEISKCLLGESRFTDEMLSQTIDRKKQELGNLWTATGRSKCGGCTRTMAQSVFP